MPLVSGTGTLSEVSIPLASSASAHTTIAAQEILQTAQVTILAANDSFRLAREVGLDVATGIQLALQIVQMGVYYDEFDDRIDDRDAKIDAQIAFMQSVDNNKFNYDVGMLNAKKTVLTGLGIPGADVCSDATRYRTQNVGDGQAVDTKADQFAGESCGGIPSGWGTHEGSLMAAKSGSYVGGLIAISAKRQREGMIDSKVPIVRSAHTSIRSVFRSNSVLSKYSQAASIHSGLADIFLQGFNSAGAALGVTLGRSGVGSSAPTTGSNANTGVTTINTGASFAGNA